MQKNVYNSRINVGLSYKNRVARRQSHKNSIRAVVFYLYFIVFLRTLNRLVKYYPTNIGLPDLKVLKTHTNLMSNVFDLFLLKNMFFEVLFTSVTLKMVRSAWKMKLYTFQKFLI